jgi:ribonuclease HI
MRPSRTAPIVVYADGSCEGNPGPGGWGVVIIMPQGTHRLSGGDSHTTNNRMELTAAIEALRALDPGTPVILRSDSQYLVRTMNDGWRRTKNQDLWQELDEQVARHRVRFEWVRGHAGDPLNEEADALARAATRTASAGLTSSRRPALAAAVKTAPPPPTPSVISPVNRDEADHEMVVKATPMLEDGERILRCAVCNERFIARVNETCCTRLACQIIKRQG